jgi:hypothetical protein
MTHMKFSPTINYYGFGKIPNASRVLRNLNYRSNLKNRTLGKALVRRNITLRTNSSFHIPTDWQFTVVRRSLGDSKQNNIYIYNDIYFFNISIMQTVETIKYNPSTRIFTFYHTHSPYCYNSFLKIVTELTRRFSCPFFLKIRFKGKGYYIYKNYRNTIAPQFGFAHRVYVYAQAASVKFLSKTKVLVFGLSKRDIMEVGHCLKAVRPINIFTGRGVRFARQVIYRKTGKVSSYR